MTRETSLAEPARRHTGAKIARDQHALPERLS
jgi:hypothetical protein